MISVDDMPRIDSSCFNRFCSRLMDNVISVFFFCSTYVVSAMLEAVLIDLAEHEVSKRITNINRNGFIIKDNQISVLNLFHDIFFK